MNNTKVKQLALDQLHEITHGRNVLGAKSGDWYIAEVQKTLKCIVDECEMPQKVYLVHEDEPESEFPSVVLGVYASREEALKRVAAEREAHHCSDDDDYMER